jgi:rare lipoprotein A
MAHVRSALLVLAAISLCTCQKQEQSEPPATVASEPPPSAQEGEPLKVIDGRAAYYSDALAGRPTASGEPYDPRALTAAHRSLPFGTRVRVVRPGSDRSVIVRINDRGPFGDDKRIMDLSRAAAEKLDMTRAGVVEIRAEVLEYGKKEDRR